MNFVGEMWPFFKPNFVNMTRYLAENALPYTSVAGFLPTGWAAVSNYNRRNGTKTKARLLYTRGTALTLYTCTWSQQVCLAAYDNLGQRSRRGLSWRSL